MKIKIFKTPFLPIILLLLAPLTSQALVTTCATSSDVSTNSGAATYDPLLSTAEYGGGILMKLTVGSGGSPGVDAI